MGDLEILGAMSGEAFHRFQASELKELQEVVDLKHAICKAKGLPNSSMLRLFEDKAEAGEVVKAVPLQDNLPLQELWRRRFPRLRALVLLPEDTAPRSSQGGKALTVTEAKPALQLLGRQAQVITQLPSELQGDRALVLEAVMKNWKVLRFCRANFQDDLEIVRQAMLQNVAALEFASLRLRGTKALFLEAVALNTAALQHLTDELREDEDLLREALRWNPFALRFASPALANRKELVMQAVKAEGLALLYAGREMREDAEVVRAAVKQNGSALIFASGELRNDRGVVSEAVGQNGLALQHASEELQTDAELLKEARRDVASLTVTQTSAAQNRGDIFSRGGLVSPRPLRHGYPVALSSTGFHMTMADC